MNMTFQAFDGEAARGLPLRIGMVVGSIAAEGGGVSEAVRALSVALDRHPSIAVEVFGIAHDGRADLDFGSVPVHRIKPGWPRVFGYSPDLVGALLQRDIDVVHVHGLWLYPSVAAPAWAQRTGRPYVVSPHGMLDPWALANRGAKKRLARVVYEDRHLRRAARIHALNDQEAEAIRAAGIETPAAVLPNGVDQPTEASGVAPWRDLVPEGARVLLFLGRVTPKKRVRELVLAWNRAHAPASRWHLVIAGPMDADYASEVEDAIMHDNSRRHVHLVGPQYGPVRNASYASADAFCLPSLSEGLPMAALEAASHGLPTLLTPQCNLPEFIDEGCALPIGTTPEAIAEGLRRLFALDDTERLRIGLKGKALVAARYGWDTVAMRFADLYREIAGAEATASR